MSQATLLLMPSEYEGLALVSYEAMAVGLPQIFSRVNGQEELITPDTGIHGGSRQEENQGAFHHGYEHGRVYGAVLRTCRCSCRRQQALIWTLQPTAS